MILQMNQNSLFLTNRIQKWTQQKLEQPFSMHLILKIQLLVVCVEILTLKQSLLRTISFHKWNKNLILLLQITFNCKTNLIKSL